MVAAIGAIQAKAPEAWAQSSSADCRSNPHLSRAKDEYDRLEFDRAARTLQRAIESARNCRWDLAEIYRLKAFVDAVNAERERCQRAFEILLALDPEYTMPPDASPKIRDCFDDALQVPVERRSLRLTHRPPGEVMPNSPVSIDVKVVDPLRLVDQVQVYFRREGVKVYTLVSARADEEPSVLIPGLSVPPDENGYQMEYFIRAVDRWEGTLDEVGDSRHPMVFVVRPGTLGSSGLVSQWWFWTALGAVVLGGAATIVVLTQQGRDEVSLVIKDGGAGL
ncbi:MAG: hypothetical protein IPK13_00900 [Deltaproteobacteria bacterium]|nr:hypothetical protein [Deltaproteobacteria bacterium]